MVAERPSEGATERLAAALREVGARGEGVEPYDYTAEAMLAADPSIAADLEDAPRLREALRARSIDYHVRDRHAPRTLWVDCVDERCVADRALLAREP